MTQRFELNNTTPTPKKSKKPFVIGLLLVLIVGMGAVGFYFSTPADGIDLEIEPVVPEFNPINVETQRKLDLTVSYLNVLLSESDFKINVPNEEGEIDTITLGEINQYMLNKYTEQTE